ncbi:MAG TPA: hypothetical protein VN880_12465 [Solirubrobacteraceae bacterium]|jgi:hypothetical protein|nr:hypothetical protein [Solirubrobacteraceae bacterium]
MTQPIARSTSEPQRLAALERANEVRLARASLKRRIAHGEVAAADVLLTCPPEASSWPIGELLVSQRRWGSSRCRKFLARNQLVETKRIGTLTERQRRVLASSLTVPVGVSVAASTSADSARDREMVLAVA